MKHDPMSGQMRIDRRKFAIGLLCASAAGVAAARQPNVHVDYLGDDKLERLVPETVGQWTFLTNSGLVVPPEDQLVRALYSQLLTRVYVAEQEPRIMFLATQSPSQTGILQIHRPEFCYTAGGYDVRAEGIHPVTLGSRTLLTSRMTATADGRTEHILYWTRLGTHLPTNWTQQRLAVALDNLQRIIPDAVMVRVSAIGDDAPATLAGIERFIRTLIASVPAPKRKVFIG